MNATLTLSRLRAVALSSSLLLAFATVVPVAQAAPDRAQAVFAGGCFWCLEADFDKVPGVLDVESGYAGGKSAKPTYKNYSSAGHIEVVRVTYDPEEVSYSELVEYFWRQVDPTDAGGQFCDRGHSYSTAIFVDDKQNERVAEASLGALERSGILDRPIVTPILNLTNFWPAEKSHQNYAKRNSWRYNYYRRRCGRDQRLEKVWKRDKAYSKSS